MKLVSGLHHVTAIASDPQKNCDFYAGILGLRMVKKTINFDAPDVYHLYYGNENGTPGTILTFFPFPDVIAGRKGNGQVITTSFSIAKDAIPFWEKRLNRFGVKYEKPAKRFDEEYIYFEDHDGLGLELVANDKDMREGYSRGHIPTDVAIKGFYSITLSEECPKKTVELLTKQLDHTLIAEEGNRLRYSAGPVGFVDILCNPEAMRGTGGSGTVHHVAFATANDESQLKARAKLVKSDLNVTPVIDRCYFHSIYFREPGGVLFEIATIPPGFAIDEDVAHLGEGFKLPPWEEKNRALLEKELTPVHVDLKRFQ
jgi:glyoxalase family protein